MQPSLLSVETLSTALKSSVEKRQLGAFYTPPPIANCLVKWAVRSETDLVLEPSFGGCGFLQASIFRFNQLGNSKPSQNIYGCDIDSAAFAHLHALLGAINIQGRFLHADFLTLNTAHFSSPLFDTVVGNPPYISRHNMSAEQKLLAEKVMMDADLSITNRASLWAPFVVHSLRFLRQGGRVAWILPTAFLTSDYSTPVRKLIELNFAKTICISLGSRIFQEEGTDEGTVVLLAEGYKTTKTGTTMVIGHAESANDLSDVINGWSNNEGGNQGLGDRYLLSILDYEIKDAFSSLEDECQSVFLGDVATFLIGLVTGANKFFLQNLSSMEENNLSIEKDEVVPIVSRAQVMPGLNLSQSDIKRELYSDTRCFVINTNRTHLTKTQREYLELFPADGREKKTTFKRRQVWYEFDDGRIPHAFLPYMNHNGLRLTLNALRINCTNTIHRVFFNRGTNRKLVTLSILTSFSQLSAEIEARSFGSGALKIEPSEAKRIRLSLPSDVNQDALNVAFSKADELLRDGKFAEARKVANQFIFGTSPLHTKRLESIETGLAYARRIRRKS